MIKKHNQTQTAFKQSAPSQRNCYSLSLCGLTLIYSKKAVFSDLTILSLDGFNSLTMPHDAIIIPYQFDQDTNAEPSPIQQQAFVLHAPSLLALWAFAAQKENPTLIHDVLCEQTFSKNFLVYLKYRLYYERFRLGSDAESLFIHRLLYRDNLGSCIPHISIKLWLEWINMIAKYK